LLVILIMLITPLIRNFFLKIEAVPEDTNVNLYLSLQCEKFFGLEMTEILIREFEELNPGIQIHLSSSEHEPDIYIFNDGDFGGLVFQNELLELNSYTNYESGSAQLAIPLVSFINLLFYNIDILTKAGFDSPPKTREEFTAYSRTVSRGDFGAAGAALSLDKNDHQALYRDVFSWIWASGIDFWENSGVPSFNTRNMINELTFLETLNREGSLANGTFETTGEQRIEQFVRGEVALMIASSYIIPYLREKMGDSSFGITIVPGYFTGGKYNIGINSIYTAISAACEYPEQAWNFLLFLTEKSSLFCSELKAVPGAVSSIIPGEYVKDDPFYSKAWEIFEASEIAEGFIGKPGAEDYRAVFLEELQSLFERVRSASQTVNRIQQRWNEISAADE